jgi:chromosome segregation ATPase
MSQRDLIGALFAGLLAVACGGGAVPSQKLINAQVAVRGAETAGAEQHPKAALHLKMARDQIAQAERFVDDDESEKAALVLDQAKADADMAYALSQEDQMRRQAEQAQARVEELRAQAQAK